MDRFTLATDLYFAGQQYKGIVVAWSAGSMNCADVVYAGPELEGEAIDPLYERWISGLGIRMH